MEIRTLRERIAQQYSAPFDAVFDSPQAKAELGEVDREQAIALLLGPIMLGKLSTLTEFDYWRSRGGERVHRHPQEKCSRTARGKLAHRGVSEIGNASKIDMLLVKLGWVTFGRPRMISPVRHSSSSRTARISARASIAPRQ